MGSKFESLRCSESTLINTLYKLLNENRFEDICLGIGKPKVSLRQLNNNVDDVIKYIKESNTNCLYFKRFGEDHFTYYIYISNLIDIRVNKRSITLYIYLDLYTTKNKTLNFNPKEDEGSGYTDLFYVMQKLLKDKKLSDAIIYNMNNAESIKKFKDDNEMIQYIKAKHANILLIKRNSNTRYPDVLLLNRIESFKLNEKSITFCVNNIDFNTLELKNIKF